MNGIQSNIDKVKLYTKDPYEADILLIKKRKSVGLKYNNDPKAFTEYSKNMNDIYEDIDEYNMNKKSKILIVFNDIIVDILSNKKPNPIVTKLFIREAKLNTSLTFVTYSYFAVPKSIRPNLDTTLL